MSCLFAKSKSDGQIFLGYLGLTVTAGIENLVLLCIWKHTFSALWPAPIDLRLRKSLYALQNFTGSFDLKVNYLVRLTQKLANGQWQVAYFLLVIT